MKNQYFGDVNDYRKYGLLRILTEASGLRVGVCWLLTPDDAKGDGELRAYLNKPARWRAHDPPLFDALASLLQPGLSRGVIRAREWDLVPGARYFEPLLLDSPDERRAYFSEAWDALSGCPLLFVDPDNGIEPSRPSWGARGSSKYVYWRELKAAFGRGNSLLIYQHYPRVPRDRFVPFLADRIAEELQCSQVTAFKTSHMVFFLAQQRAHRDALNEVPRSVARRWLGQLEPWPEVVTTGRSGT